MVTAECSLSQPVFYVSLWLLVFLSLKKTAKNAVSCSCRICILFSKDIIPCAYVLSCFSHVWLFVTQWTSAHQVPLSMGFSRQEYWSGLPCPPPGDLPDPGSNPCLLCLLNWQVGSLKLAPPGRPRIIPQEAVKMKGYIYFHNENKASKIDILFIHELLKWFSPALPFPLPLL